VTRITPDGRAAARRESAPIEPTREVPVDEGAEAMDRPDQTTDQPQASRRPCLVDGCTCKDARIVSRRRAAYFAARARVTGQTADRFVPTEDGWLLPGQTRRAATVAAAPAVSDMPVWRLGELTVRLVAKD
jgi:hypothetical protein